MRRLDLVRQDTEVVLGGGLLMARNARPDNRNREPRTSGGTEGPDRVVDVPPIAGAALLGLDHLGRVRKRMTGCAMHTPPPEYRPAANQDNNSSRHRATQPTDRAAPERKWAHETQPATERIGT